MMMEVFCFFCVNDNAVTTMPAAIAPMNAKKLTGEKYLIIVAKKLFCKKDIAETAGRNAVAKTAPKVAPEVMPRIPGSASGFLKKSWKTAPLAPKRMPARRTRSALGKRRFQTIVFSNVSACVNIEES